MIKTNNIFEIMRDFKNPSDDKGRSHGYCVFKFERGTYEVNCLHGNFNGIGKVVNLNKDLLIKSNWETALKEGEEHQYFYTE